MIYLLRLARCQKILYIRPFLQTSFLLLLVWMFSGLAIHQCIAQEAPLSDDLHPLRPTDTTSPAATLKSFNTYMNRAIDARRSGAPRSEVQMLAERALETFDFSKLPLRGRLAIQAKTALQLKEILNRIGLPADDSFPDTDNGDASGTPVQQWTIPDTQITIGKVSEGPRKGAFLFTAETVKRMETYYQRAKHLPYKPGAQQGVYDQFIHSPGYLVPGVLAEAIPDWSRSVVLGEAIWQWIGLVIGFIIAICLIWLSLRLGRRWDEKHSRAKSHMKFGMPVGVLASILIIFCSGQFLLHGLTILGPVFFYFSIFMSLSIFTLSGWFVLLASSYAADVINSARHSKEGSIDGQLVRTILTLTSLVIVVFLVVFAAGFYGFPLTPVLAGVGVGSLAVALAIRPTLENVIGGLTLFADRPVRIGDMCQFGPDIGTVEEIGLRSTRLRKRNDTVVSVPNGDFAQRELTNLSKRRRRLYKTTLGLRYETTPEQLRYVIAKLREMLDGHPKVSPDELNVRFLSFGAYSLDVEVFAYIRTRDWQNYRAICEDINLRIMDIVNEAGSGFAFPSQTTYLGRDTGIDAERGREVEARVQEWRSKDQLPFPNFPEDEQLANRDSLDYPPVGSPDYKPRDKPSGNDRS